MIGDIAGIVFDAEDETRFPAPHQRQAENVQARCIHHTAFVHGSVIPVGEEVAEFEAHQEGDRILTSGVLRKPGRSGGMPFRDDFLLPCLNSIELSPRIRILVSSTPVPESCY